VAIADDRILSHLPDPIDNLPIVATDGILPILREAAMIT
jgi:hypothetical protein